MSRLQKQQRGAIAIMVALSLVALIGFLALAIDLGHLYLAKTGLQNAADAAALSGASRLDGSAASVYCDSSNANCIPSKTAVFAAMDIASRNTFFGLSGQSAVEISENDIWVSSVPNPDSDADATTNWEPATAAASSASDRYFFIKVDTGTHNLTTWFAPLLNITQTYVGASAVAGRYPPSALAPVFVPVIRRNANQRSLDATYPNCKGYVYDPKTYKSSCPTTSGYPDFSGNWGYVSAGVCKKYQDTQTQEMPCSSSGWDEKGSYYVMTPKTATAFDQNTPGLPSKGNFGFMLVDENAQTMNAIMEQLCRGGSPHTRSIPGCSNVHTGALSAPKITANLNTRFDQQGNLAALSHDLCPSDTNISQSIDWQGLGFYGAYAAEQGVVSPTQFPPGEANRRIIRAYVVDNALLDGFALGGADSSCTTKLTGSSRQAHIVGCADFFMWKAADAEGRVYVEYIKSVKEAQCNSPIAASNETRLYE